MTARPVHCVVHRFTGEFTGSMRPIMLAVNVTGARWMRSVHSPRTIQVDLACVGDVLAHLEYAQKLRVIVEQGAHEEVAVVVPAATQVMVGSLW